MARSNGANFVRGYFTFVRGYIKILLWFAVLGLGSLAVLDRLRPDLHVYLIPTKALTK
jgi:hypothetical protein